MLSVDELEYLARYRDGALAPEDRLKLEAELRVRPELRAGLSQLEALDNAVHLLEPTMTSAEADALVSRVLQATPTKPKGATFALMVIGAAVAMMLGLLLAPTKVRPQLVVMSGPVVARGQTWVAGDVIEEPRDIVMGESSGAVLRLKEASVLIPAGAELELRDALRLKRGAVLVRGRARVDVDDSVVSVDGVSVLTMEPRDADPRVTLASVFAEDFMAHVWTRLSMLGGGAAAFIAGAVYCLEGESTVAVAAAAPVRVVAREALRAGVGRLKAPLGDASILNGGSLGSRQADASVNANANAAEAEAEASAASGATDAGVLIAMARDAAVPAGMADGNALPTTDAGGRAYPTTTDGIRDAIHSRMKEFSSCYESWIEMEPKLSGRLFVSFRIEENMDGGGGIVRDVGLVDGGIGNVAFEGCIMNVLSGMDFEIPPDGGAVNVRYPLNFANDESAAVEGP
jgi:hypothetical protein